MSKVMSPAIQNILRASYDELEQKQKEIFLDIAVFFNGENKEMATRIWEGWEQTFWLIDLLILEHKCLIKFENGCLNMHSLLCDLGRSIVDEECLEDPGRRSRLWRKTDLRKVLTNGTGTDSVRGLSLVSEGSVLWNEDRFFRHCAWPVHSFAGMRRLKLLVLQDACVVGDFSKLAQRLLWLRWLNCPYQSMPPNLQFVRVLDVRGGKLETLWSHHSQIPLKLKELNMESCHRLQRIPHSIGMLEGLRKICFDYCTLVTKLPAEFCNLHALEHLSLKGCENLKDLPRSFGDLRRLQHLDLTRCRKLRMLPQSFGFLPQLKFLSLAHCNKMKITANSLGNISTLTHLDLWGCGIVEKLPTRITFQHSLARLFVGVSEARLQESLDAIKELNELRHLMLYSLEYWKEIRPIASQLSPEESDCVNNIKMQYVEAPMNTHELSLLSTSSSLTKLKNLQVLYLVGFHSLKSMVLGFSGLSNLKCLLLHDCKEIVQLPGLGFLAHMEKLYINHSPKLHSLDGLNELKHLKHLHVFLSEDVLQQNSMVLQQNLPSISETVFTTSAIPYPTARLDSVLGSPYFAVMPSNRLDLDIKTPPRMKKCVAIIVCFISTILVCKFHIQFGVPYTSSVTVTYSQQYFMRSHAFNLMKLSIPSNCQEEIGTSKFSLQISPLTNYNINRIKQGWMQLIHEGEEHKIQHIYSAVFQELRRAQSFPYAIYQMDLRNLHVLDLANCRIRRICHLGNTPLELEETGLVWRKQQLLFGNAENVVNLNVSTVCQSFVDAIKPMANVYKMEVSITANGVAIHTDEKEESLKMWEDALAQLPLKFLNILEAKKREANSKRKKERKRS